MPGWFEYFVVSRLGFPLAAEITWRLFYSVSVLLGALLITTLVRFSIRRRMRKCGGVNLRADTLTKLLKSVASYIVWFFAVLQVIQVGLGVNLGAILAAAGVLGIAVGFGAQTLVRDIIAGFFLLFENQFAVGEQVTIGDFTGAVAELGLRSTRIRGEDGDLLTVPNGAIVQVVNHSRK